MIRPRRPGYTLLEVLIASVIGLMLMGAVYVLFDISIRQQNDGRDMVTESNLSRGVIHRMSLDLASPLGTLPPKSGGTPAAAASTTTPTTTTDDTTATPTVTNIPFQAGLVAAGTQMVLFVSKPVSYLRNRSTPFDPAAPLAGSDLMKITYYMHSSGTGLCRQERPWVTSEGIWNSTDPDRATEEQDLIAPEVTNIVYEFASGTSWVTDWDGQLADTNGATNQGPPRAVRITVTFSIPGRSGKTTEQTIQHTFAIRAAAGLLTNTTTTTTDSTTPATGTTP